MFQVALPGGCMCKDDSDNFEIGWRVQSNLLSKTFDLLLRAILRR